MSAPDPSFLQDYVKYLWSVLLLPVGILWKKVDGAVQKDDFKDFIARFDQHVRDDRETQAKLFDKVDEVKTLLLERIPNDR
jgi:hypothetical protein